MLKFDFFEDCYKVRGSENKCKFFLTFNINRVNIIKLINQFSLFNCLMSRFDLYFFVIMNMISYKQ